MAVYVFFKGLLVNRIYDLEVDSYNFISFRNKGLFFKR